MAAEPNPNKATEKGAVIDAAQKRPGNVNFLIEEIPSRFLKKIITLCHILMYLTRMNDHLVLSRELYRDYWQVKHDPLKDILLEACSKEDHRAKLQNAVEKSKATDFFLP